jgi:hypothetical protein
MKLSTKQKTFISIGIIVILLTPLVVIFGTPVIMAKQCSAEAFQTICTTLSSTITSVLLIFPSLFVGTILLLIGVLSKNKK